jgi:type VI secretion system secreted protein Hcp
MAHVDFFLKVDGIEGECQDACYKGAIQIGSWRWGEIQPINGSGFAGKVKMDGVFCTMMHNKASPRLLLACASGDHIKKAKLICRKAGGRPHVFYILTMTDVLIASYSVAGGEGTIIPNEQILINFAAVEWEYFEQKSDGSSCPGVKTGWNLNANSAM